ncbi:hypothetical protein PLICRDRAFT_119678 [Plicaturopsis crispa FD-325 SS-3]|uniref:G-patch domain-containing protein n=1 Tax=Plicaturopsis crispa FD-325 SS-3 TaxID=944288 RepID=A0A0C9SK74_PLICR|nr:hypothetical protein PLICRDRAFT_119678 [Plicaturopsis crispa FD-325 SS-3]
MSAASKVSFTIRRPTPPSRSDSTTGGDNFKVPSLPRHLADDSRASSANSSPRPKSRTYHERDSSDEEDEGLEEELITGFDHLGAQRSPFRRLFCSLHEKKKAAQGPLVIPALQNKDWRALARKRRGATQYVPPSAAAVTGADGSVGGLGTRDTINSGPQREGLYFNTKKLKVEADAEADETVAMDTEEAVKKEDPETEDQRALRAILAGTDGTGDDGPTIDIIPPPVSETDALRQDVEELPDEATIDDYNRVPVSQFGAALLRGMGWTQGTAASKKHKGPVEPYLPSARPALLGIGAKEREALDDGSKPRKGGAKRPERRYVPVVKTEKAGAAGADRAGSGTPGGSSRRRSPESRSRRHSRSPVSSSRRHHDRDERRSERDYDSRRDKRDYDRDKRDYDRERPRDGGERDSQRRDRDRDRERRSDDGDRRRGRDRRDY